MRGCVHRLLQVPLQSDAPSELHGGSSGVLVVLNPEGIRLPLFEMDPARLCHDPMITPIVDQERIIDEQP